MLYSRTPPSKVGSSSKRWAKRNEACPTAGRLGGDRDSACVTCHHPALGGGDALPLSIGVGADDPELRVLLDDLSSARTRLAYLTVAGPDEDHPEAWRELVEDARSAKERAERQLAQASASYRRDRERESAGFEVVSFYDIFAGRDMLAEGGYDASRSSDHFSARGSRIIGTALADAIAARFEAAPTAP